MRRDHALGDGHDEQHSAFSVVGIGVPQSCKSISRACAKLEFVMMSQRELLYVRKNGIDSNDRTRFAGLVELEAELLSRIQATDLHSMRF
jgi:hypothetical protein